MAISKAALIEMVDKTLADHEKAVDENKTATEEWNRKRREKWDVEAVPKIRQLRDMFTAKLKAGQVITDDDVTNVLGRDRHGWGRNVSEVTWSPNATPSYREVKTVPHIDLSQLRQLKSALSIIEGDSITPSALAQWGFRNLGWLFKAADQLTKEGK
ncbi:hypothetical protein [Mycobacteroides abscessus]|uniref:hypothetical protein n=1 Tax=Mycobacteroides abscessus TaxID=36809 RepID=UPI000E691087|nr:hypothetical protein [Mycobacteroides abscessus]RIS87415.1 hypothetical protein D2E44_02570 [Mycobacteroides abscessus]